MALLWFTLAAISVYSQAETVRSTCFIPAGLTMALLLLYGAGATPAVFVGSLLFAGVMPLLPFIEFSWSPLYGIYSLIYATGHTFIYLLTARYVREYCRGFIRLEKPKHVFAVLLGGSIASAATALLVALINFALHPGESAELVNDFLQRWMSALTGVLCFALSFTTLFAYTRSEKHFPTCHLDTRHLRKGIQAEHSLPWLILLFALIIFALDWLGSLSDVQHFTVAWMGIVTLFTLAWAALRLSYGAVSILVAVFSAILLVTLSAFWEEHQHEVANIQILLPTIAIAGTFLWSLGNSVTSNKRLHELANTDELTSLANRRYWFQVAQKEFNRSLRYQNRLCILLIDLDHFKKINDNYGHQTGDEALQHAASVMQSQLREESTLCRYGGEEFALLLPECHLDKAYRVAERLREALSSSPIKAKGEKLQITASLGIANSNCEDERLEQIVARADEALYQAKSAGRNRVCPEVEA